MNTLYFGDNLYILRKYIKDESVDLIYLDPPFNSQRAYNVIFQDKTGKAATAQIQAFEDTWYWTQETQDAFDQIMEGTFSLELKEMMKAFKDFMGTNNLMAYLTMMAIRLVELHRVLKPTGSLYLHCDPTASHYLKVLLDQVFGVTNFRTEIIWKRSSAHSDAKQGRAQHGRIHDVILFYTRSAKWAWNQLYTDYDKEYVDAFYKYVDAGTGRRYRLDNLTGPGGAAKGNPEYEVMGVRRFWRYTQEKMKELIKQGRVIQTVPGAVPAYKRYLDEMSGVPLQDIWTDIRPVSSQGKERLGYPTQKPVPLLERIIQTSSNEGDVVLDPFCGCGTAIAAAEKLGRRWLGIDITFLAIALIKKRIKDHFPDAKFDVTGEPTSLEDAEALFHRSAFQFEAWAVSLLGGQPYKSTGGGDTGMDGFLYFKDYEDKFHRIIIEVKGGGYHPKDVRALAQVLKREKSPMGVLLALKPPTKGMITEAAELGKWKMPGGRKSYPVLQLVTIEDIFAGKLPDLPDTGDTLKKAKRELRDKDKRPPRLGDF